MSSLLFEEKGVQQGVVRTSRYKLRNIIGAVLRLQAWLRGTSIRWALRACSHAAAVIQALLRGVQARRRCLQLRTNAAVQQEAKAISIHQLRESLQAKRTFINATPRASVVDIDVAVSVDDAYPDGWVKTLHGLWAAMAERGATIRSVALGECHTVALTSRSELVAWGWNDRGQTGHGDAVSKSKAPRLMLYRDCFSRVPVKQIAAGSNFTGILDSNGRVLTCGCNKRGQLGLATKRESISTPRLVGGLQKHCVRKMACGSNFMVVVTSRGELYSWGAAESCGFLGKQRSGRPTATATCCEDQPSPRRIAPLAHSNHLHVVDVACGSGHTLALVRDYRLPCGGNGDGSFQGSMVYSFGTNGHGELGRGAGTDGKRPEQVAVGGFPDAIACGSRHSLILGRCFSTRRGLRQVFSDDHDEVQFLVSFGCNASGQLGLGDLVARSQPAAVQGVSLVGRSRVLRVACGARSSAVLVGTGDGWNEQWRLVWGSVGGRRFCNPTRRELPGPFAELDGALDLSTAWSRTYSATFLRAAEAPTTMLRAAHFQGYVGSDG